MDPSSSSLQLPQTKRLKVESSLSLSFTNNHNTNNNNHQPHDHSQLLHQFGHLLSSELCHEISLLSTNQRITTTTTTMESSVKRDSSSSSSTSTDKTKQKMMMPVQMKNDPFPHGIIQQFFSISFLQQLIDEMKQNSTVHYKESDLFKVYQSMDLANLSSVSSVSSSTPTTTTTSTSSTTTSQPQQQPQPEISSLYQLRDLLYSIEFRHYIEELHNLPYNTLNGNQIDCAANCHLPGCHLLCHDDVIGTRKISYILYLTDPDWEASDGGALELYDSSCSSCSTTTTTNNTSDSQQQHGHRIPHTDPCTTILPKYNRMVFFLVQPGYSFHSVQEVFGTRPRLSIQGWYHSNDNSKNNSTAATANSTTDTTVNTNLGKPSINHPHQYATLQRLKSYRNTNANNTTTEPPDNYKNNMEDTEGPYTPIRYDDDDNMNNNVVSNRGIVHDVTKKDHSAVVTLNGTNNDTTTTLSPIETTTLRNPCYVSESDKVYLRQYICDTYLTDDAISNINQQFSQDSSIQLRHFLNDTHIVPIQTRLQQEVIQRYTNNDDDDNNNNNTNNISDEDQTSMNGSNSNSCRKFYEWGVVPKVWESVGPPHKQRFLEYVAEEPTSSSSAPLQSGRKSNDMDSSITIGSQLRTVQSQLFQSHQFYNYLTAITNLGRRPTSYRGRVRRFRPGRDYTVAHYGLLTERSVLDATLCFVKEMDEDDMNPSSASDTIVLDGADDDDDPTLTESMEVWQSGDCGGFECYISADDDDDNKNTTATAPDEYNMNPNQDNEDDDNHDDNNNDDDTELLNVSASNNTLSLVYRDPGTMRFIKYVSVMAPSSRYDITMEYEFPHDNDDDIEEDEDVDEENDKDDDIDDSTEEEEDGASANEDKELDDNEDDTEGDDQLDDTNKPKQDVNSDDEWRI